MAKRKKRHKRAKSLTNKNKINSVAKKNETKLSRISYLLNIRFVRFLIVGTINTVFGYGVYAVLLSAGMEYKLANLGSLIAGIIFSFKTQSKFVFKNVDNKLFLRFLPCWIIIYFFNIFIIGRLIIFGFNAYQAGAIALIPATLFSYFAQKLIVFR